MRNSRACRKSFKESLKSNLQQQPQEVEQRRHDLMPEHQKVQKRSRKTRGGPERKLIEMMSDFGSYRTTSWKQNFRGCRQEKKEEAVMLRKRWIATWRRWWNRLRLESRSGEVSVRCFVPGVLQQVRGQNPFCADARKRRRKKEW